MNTDTGEILSLDEVKKRPFEEQKKFKLIPPGYVDAIQGMNRSQRRRWYRENKKLFKDA